MRLWLSQLSRRIVVVEDLRAPDDALVAAHRNELILVVAHRNELILIVGDVNRIHNVIAPFRRTGLSYVGTHPV